MWEIERTDEIAEWISSLIGGDKKGDKRFYEKMISIADSLYEKHVKQLRLAHENKRKK